MEKRLRYFSTSQVLTLVGRQRVMLILWALGGWGRGDGITADTCPVLHGSMTSPPSRLSS